ncbi:MAG: efflux RND transporter periplasmic adaptor subunit, partial [Pseudomonadota bacterium]
SKALCRQGLTYPCILINLLKTHTMFRFILLILTFLLLIGCEQYWPFATNQQQSKSQVANNKTKKLPKPLPVVHVSTVKKRNLSFSAIITGTLEAKRRVKIFNQIEGVLIKLPFYEGDRVKKNQNIALLDKTLVQLELNKAIVNEKQSSINLNRIKKLIPKNLVSQDEISQAKTLLSLARNETKKQRTKLSYTNIKAPFSGVISQRLNEPGDVLSEHSHILSLIDTSQLIVQFQLSELLLPDININDEISLHIDALGQQKFTATVIRKHPVIDMISRQGIVEAILTSPPIGAMPGQLSRINFTSKKKNYLTIPLPAIRHDQHSAYVYLLNLNNQTVSKQNITMGMTIDNFAEITNGVNEGDSIVVKGQYGLKSGSKVQIITKQ